jgi:hypothetical protein
MTRNDPFGDLENLRLLPMPEVRTGQPPAKIMKRVKDFVMVPMSWLDELEGCSGHTYHVALHLLYLHWKNRGKPFPLANGMLRYDGVSRQSKWRALLELERRGLITIERRPRKSPIIHPHLELRDAPQR